MIRTSVVLLAGFCASVMASSAGASVIADAAGDYSISNNPNGVWTYGFLDPTNSDTATNLTPMNTSHTNWDGNTNVDSWDLNNGTFGEVADNTTNTTQNVAGTIELNPNSDDQLVLHPEQLRHLDCGRSFHRASAMDVNISAAFAAADTSGTTTDVHIYVNGASIYNSTVTGAYPTAAATPFAGDLVHLSAGDTVDFSVGFGSNETYYDDGTSLTATISTPEPASLSLLGIGAVSLLAQRRRLCLNDIFEYRKINPRPPHWGGRF